MLQKCIRFLRRIWVNLPIETQRLVYPIVKKILIFEYKVQTRNKNFSKRHLRNISLHEPRVSIVLPVYNDQEYLLQAIDSVLTQGYLYLELIIVDDASDDFSLDIAMEAKARDPRVKVFRHKENLGLAASRNTGISYATAPYITFLDSDDYLFPNSIRGRLDAIEKSDLSNLAGCYSDWDPVPELNPPKSPSREPRLDRGDIELGSNNYLPSFTAGAPMLLTEVIRKHSGFDETFFSAEDFDLWSRILRSGYVFEYVPLIGYAYRQRSQGMVQGNPSLHAEAMSRVYDYLERPLTETDIHRNSEIKTNSFPIEFDSPSPRLISISGSLTLAIIKEDPKQEERIRSLIRGRFRVEEILTDEVLISIRSSIGRVHKAVGGNLPQSIDYYIARTVIALCDEANSVDSYRVVDGKQDLNKRDVSKSAIIPQDPELLPITDPRFGGVILCPLARYHVDELGPLAEELERLGHRVSFLLAPNTLLDQVVKEMRKFRFNLFSWPEKIEDMPKFSAIVSLNDWGPTKELCALARERGVPSFAKVEGVQDFTDVDTGRIRSPYLNSTHVLCQGQNDMEALKGQSTHVVGNSRLEKIYRSKERSFGNTRIVAINSNFTYNVLTEHRADWLTSVLRACRKIDATPIISLHPADERINDKHPITDLPMKSLLKKADVLVSRFSTVPFEAMALGIPFIYHNPHRELVPTFKVPKGAFRITETVGGLAHAIDLSLDWRGSYRSMSSEFFQKQIDINERSSSERSALFIDQKIQKLD